MLCRRISIKGTARRAPTRAVYCVAFARICTACGSETTRCSPHRNQRVVARANTACGIETCEECSALRRSHVAQANTVHGFYASELLYQRASLVAEGVVHVTCPCNDKFSYVQKRGSVPISYRTSFYAHLFFSSSHAGTWVLGTERSASYA